LSWDESLRTIKEKTSKSLDDISNEIFTIDSMILDILRETHIKVPTFIDIQSLHTDASFKFINKSNKEDLKKGYENIVKDKTYLVSVNEMPSKSISTGSLKKKLLE